MIFSCYNVCGGNMFTDTHCHLFNEYYNNLDDIINKAMECDVNRFFVAGCDHVSNMEIIHIDNDKIFKVLGIHPESVLTYQDSEIDYIKEHINDNRVIAIGEIGLDYHYGKDNIEEQKALFRKQLELAEKVNKPVVIHSRDAVKDTMDILKGYKVKGVIHSFSGSIEVAKEYIKMGYLLGINGVITFKNCNLKDILLEIGLDNIILETDSPYLTPEPFRGQTNEPARIRDIALFVANIFGISLDELAKKTNENIARIFDI